MGFFIFFVMAGINPVCAQEFWWSGNCLNGTMSESGGSQTIPYSTTATLYSDEPFYGINPVPFAQHSTTPPYYASYDQRYTGENCCFYVNLSNEELEDTGIQVYFGVTILAQGVPCNEGPTPTPTPGPTPNSGNGEQYFWWSGNCENNTIFEYHSSQTITYSTSAQLNSNRPFLTESPVPYTGHSTVYPYFNIYNNRYVGDNEWFNVLGANEQGQSTGYEFSLGVKILNIGETCALCSDCNTSNTTILPNFTNPVKPTSTIPNSPWNQNTSPVNVSWPSEPNWTFTPINNSIGLLPTEIPFTNITNRTNITNMFNQSVFPEWLTEPYFNFFDYIFSFLISIILGFLNAILSPVYWLINILLQIEGYFIDAINNLLYYIKPVAALFQIFFFILPPVYIYIGTLLLCLDFIWWVLHGRK